MADQFMDEWLEFSELIDKVQDYIELCFYDEALKYLNDYKHIYKDEWEIYFLYSRIYAEQNKPDEAISFLLKCLQLDKENTDCLLGIFYAYSMKNDIKKGGKFLLQAYKYHPENEMVHISLVWYYTEINDIKNAISHFGKLCEAGTTNPEAYKNGGLAYERSGDYENAELCFKTAIELNPGYEDVIDILADHYLFLEQYEKAIDLYRDAIKYTPKNIRLMSRLVFCYSQSEKNDLAASIAKESIKLYPNSPVGYVDLAYVYLNTLEFDKSIKYADLAIDVAPLDPEAYRVKGIAYSEKNNFEEAELSFQTAISFDNENAEIIRDYYNHLRNAGKYDEMIKWIHKVIKIEYPYCMEDYWFLADFYDKKKNTGKAFHFLNKAYKSMPVENELIPPIIDIMLNKKHICYTLPFFVKYVEKSGWNDTMNKFSKHKRLKGKWEQEGIRFLRFWGQKNIEYRKFIFPFYIKKYLNIFIFTSIIFFLIPLSFLFGLSVLLISILSLGTFYFLSHLVKYLLVKKYLNLNKLKSVLS